MSELESWSLSGKLKSYSQEIEACSRPFSGFLGSNVSLSTRVYCLRSDLLPSIFKTMPSNLAKSQCLDSPVVRWEANPAPPNVLISSVPWNTACSEEHVRYDCLSQLGDDATQLKHNMVTMLVFHRRWHLQAVVQFTCDFPPRTLSSLSVQSSEFHPLPKVRAWLFSYQKGWILRLFPE